MDKGISRPLTANEQVTLRRVAYGQSEVRAMRRHDLTRLRELKLIEDGKDGPRLTADGKQRFEVLPKAASLDNSATFEEMLSTIGQRILGRPKDRNAKVLKSKGPAI